MSDDLTDSIQNDLEEKTLTQRSYTPPAIVEQGDMISRTEGSDTHGAIELGGGYFNHYYVPSDEL